MKDYIVIIDPFIPSNMNFQTILMPKVTLAKFLSYFCHRYMVSWNDSYLKYVLGKYFKVKKYGLRCNIYRAVFGGIY